MTEILFGVRVEFFLVLSALMFFIGVCGFIIRRNLITVLMAIELMLNAVNINFAVFNKFLFPAALDGHFFILIIVAIAAAEAAVAIALVINIYRNFQSINSTDANIMKH
jgi:NADH:ubiquinone oxidoreductase subunit K